MNKTAIEWVKNPDGSQGYTFNPITGCLNNCSYCYARRLANTRLKERYLANNTIAPVPEPISLKKVGEHLQDPFYPRFWEDRMNLRSLVKSEPKGIFVCDMSDLFGIGIPEVWTQRVLNTIQALPTHRFYLLTKQPQNLIKFQFPDNAWVGVSATDSDMLFMAMHYLENIQAGKKFVSIEPMLERCYSIGLDRNLRASVDQVIIGAQTKPTVYPKIEWVQEIETAARNAGIAIFEKNNLKPLLKRDLIQELPQ